MELFEQIRREYDFGVGTIRGVAHKLKMHRRMMRQALASAEPPEHATCMPQIYAPWGRPDRLRHRPPLELMRRLGFENTPDGRPRLCVLRDDRVRCRGLRDKSKDQDCDENY
jgi:hypothetical protein